MKGGHASFAESGAKESHFRYRENDCVDGKMLPIYLGILRLYILSFIAWHWNSLHIYPSIKLPQRMSPAARINVVQTG